MNLRQIIGLRPKTQDVTAIRAALAGAEEAQATALATLATLEAGRAAILLEGDAATFEKSERDIATTRGDAERAGIMVDALRDRLHTAERDSVLRNVRASVAEAHAASEKFLAFMRDEYPRLAERIAQGMRMEEQANEANAECSRALADLPPAEADQMRAENIQPPGNPASKMSPAIFMSFNREVRLPAANGNVWPPTPTYSHDFRSAEAAG